MVTTMKKVLVLFGGVSSEHEISLVSARSVIQNIPRDRYEVLTLGITRQGEWLLYEGDPEALPEDQWLKCGRRTPAVLSPDASHHGLLVLEGGKTRVVCVDVVFPVLHGKNGEDGTVQGLLQLAQIPFVGCGCTASAITMDKAITNALADAAGIPQAKWLPLARCDYDRGAAALRKQAISRLSFPIFVKPANAGSSVGVGKATTETELADAIETAFQYDEKLVLEEGIDGMEVECAVLGNESPEASMVGEVVPCNDFYDYEAKYIADDSELHIPARLPEDTIQAVRDAACRVFASMGCSGLARVDFFVREGGAVFLNEPNTIPGFTPISMYPKLWERSGLPYGALLDRLIRLALEKWEPEG